MASLIRKTLEKKPKNATHWSTRTMAKKLGVSHMTVARVWRALGVYHLFCNFGFGSTDHLNLQGA